MYIDTHCHLSVDDYDDIDLIIKENRENDIDKIIISGCTKDTIIESIDIAKKYEDVYLTVGYHPSETRITDDSNLELLVKQIEECNKIVGIGEIGLDYHYGKEDLELQKSLFEKQMKLAEKFSLPVVIHTRDATFDTISILKKFPNVKGVIHCFSGSVETAKIYISMGYKLGIGGVITFKNSNLQRVVQEIGLDNIVIETDSPYLTPEPFRGKKNSSKYLALVAKKISNIFELDINDVADKLRKNTYELFDLK